MRFIKRRGVLTAEAPSETSTVFNGFRTSWHVQFYKRRGQPVHMVCYKNCIGCLSDNGLGSRWRQSLSRRSTVVCRPTLLMTYVTTNRLERFGRLQRHSFNDHSLSLPLRLVLLLSLHPSSGTLSVNTRSADSLTYFKRRLKSELFATVYATWDGSVPSQRFDSCFYATYRAFINCFSSSSSRQVETISQSF